MITLANTTWTDPAETKALQAEFEKELGPDTETPTCLKCGRQTCYIVEEGRATASGGFRADRRGVNTLFGFTKKHDGGASQIAAMVTDTRLFVPIKVCNGCGGAEEGWLAAAHGKVLETELARADGMALTAEEKVTWRSAFKAAFLKRRGQIVAAKDDVEAKKGRYTPKRAGGAA